jgi:hypothetical protein
MRTKMKTNKTVLCRLLPLFALTLIVGAFLFAGTVTAYAAEPAEAGTPAAVTETLTVNEVWLTGDTLHIAVTDKASGESQTLELNLSDYAKSGDEYVTVQATDSAGRKSNAIQFRNPYYVASESSAPNAGNTPDGGAASPAPSGSTESAVPDGAKPLTPDGTGTVVDNVTDGDGKEFFSITTADGNTFYLIVDRQRNADNVYLLNAVTENNLASLAKPGDGKSESAIPSVTPPASTATPEPTPEVTAPPAAEKSGGNMGTIAFVIIAVLAVGGAGYYFKIVRPKQQGAAEDDYEDEPEDSGFDDDEEADVEDDDEGGDGE